MAISINKLSVLAGLAASILAFASCGPNTTGGNAPKSEKADSFAVFKALFNGTWVQTSYFEDVAKTKSPCQSQNKVTMVIAFQFSSPEMHGDSMEVGGVGIHEGAAFYVHFRPGFTATSLPTNITGFDTVKMYYELGYELAGHDTMLSITQYNAEKKQVGKEMYARANGEPVAAFNTLLNKKLFSGTYKYADSVGHPQKATFTDDGKVTGFNGHNGYSVSSDFIAGPENNLDEIIMDNYTKARREYTYVIKGDTLCLYDTRESKDGLLLERTRLRYKLIKQ
jgi:hypothetical protein